MSFQIAIPKSRKIAGRFIGRVRRELQCMLASEPEISRSQVADAIGVHRSVITKQLNGTADLSLGRVAEIAWAAGYRPKIELVKIENTGCENRPVPVVPAMRADGDLDSVASDAGEYVVRPSSMMVAAQ